MEENVLVVKAGEGALRDVLLFRSPGLLFTSGKTELPEEIALKIGLNNSRTWQAAVTFLEICM